MAEVRPAALQKQGDGSKKQWENCAAASAAMAALRARKNVNPKLGFPWLTTTLPTMSSAIRKWCDNHFDTTVVDGLYQSWVNKAVKRMYGVTMGYAFGIDWRTAVAFLKDHRGITVTIQYSEVLGTRYASSSTFRGRHRVYVNHRRRNKRTGKFQFLVYDPLADGRRAWVPKGPQWWPAGLLRRATEAAGIEVSYTPKTA